MAIGLSSSKRGHRYDNATKPVLTFTGLDANLHRLFIPNERYASISVNPYTWSPANRTIDQSVKARNLTKSVATLSSGIVRDTVTYNHSNYLSRAGVGPSYIGASFSTVASGNVSIEGYTRFGVDGGEWGLSLQSGVFNFDYNNAAVNHSIVFYQNGKGQVIEKGVTKALFKYDSGDGGLIEMRNGLVKYYLIKASKLPVLLFSTRSTMSYPITPSATLYTGSGNFIDDVILWIGDEDIEPVYIMGALSGEIQDLRNPSVIESLVEKTLTKGKKEDNTYFSDLRNIQGVAINLEWRFETEYQDFKEFFQWHDMSEPWIFTDMARTKLFPNYIPKNGLEENQMIVRFASPFKDNPLGAGLYGASGDIIQFVNPPVIGATW